MVCRIGCIVGSTSTRSINRKLLHGLMTIERERDHAGAACTWEEIPITDLPLYTYDADDEYPPVAERLKAAIRESDALVIATPEYNRSIPGALKNAIDWASRPYGESAWGGKPVGILGASVGTIGTAAAQQHLRTILAYLDAPALGQPEVFVQFTKDRFADDGRVVDDGTRDLLASWLDAFHDWVGRHPRR